MIISLFVVGVQKGGTTALDRALREEANLAMAREKEVHFFDDDAVDWRTPRYERYHEQFLARSGAVYGEVTPIYCYWPGAMERIASYNPSARIVMMLRHPTFRARSQWRMETDRENDDFSFADAIREPGRSRVRNSPGGVHRCYSYVERGFYAEQIARLRALFAAEQLLFIRTDALWHDPTSVVARVCAHAGVQGSQALTPRRYVDPVPGRERVGMAADDRKHLDQLFADDICATGELSGLDLDDWLDPNYDEPMRRPNEVGTVQ